MSNYVILTDSGCDIRPDVLKNWDVSFASLTFKFDNDEKEYLNFDLPSKEFYDRMREGECAKTSAINVAVFTDFFKPYLEDGKDILYIGFSGGLSTTCNSGRIAADELVGKYPNRKIVCIDSLCASAGQGMFLKLAVDKKAEGASLEENAAYLEKMLPHMAHWFTVDDLVYLKRGGRVSAATALLGGMLNIKPVLHVDDEGHLISMSKVRGRRASIKALADMFTETAVDNTKGPVFISHGDCIDDAKALATLIEETHGVETEIITDVGPVIGSHSGPGTLALFFIAKER